MKTREWLFTIAIIILIQFIVQVGALIYSSNNNVLNYISFAGTIVSIILATIAIVYSFVQTISQQSASSNISNQVDKLISVVDQIHDSKNIINTSIEHLRRASGKLDAAIENQSTIHQNVQIMTEKLSDLYSFNTPQTEIDNKQTATKNTPAIETQVKDFSTWNDGTKLCALYIFWGSQNKLSLEKTVSLIANPIVEKIYGDGDHKEFSFPFMDGTITATFHTLKNCHLADEENNQISLDGRLEEACKIFINELTNSKETSTLKQYINAYSEIENDINT